MPFDGQSAPIDDIDRSRTCFVHLTRLLFYLMYWAVIFAAQLMVHEGNKRRFAPLWTLIAIMAALSHS